MSEIECSGELNEDEFVRGCLRDESLASLLNGSAQWDIQSYNTFCQGIQYTELSNLTFHVKKELSNKVGTIAEVFWSPENEEGTAFPLEHQKNGFELMVTLDILT